jgi:hypothetical protein
MGPSPLQIKFKLSEVIRKAEFAPGGTYLFDSDLRSRRDHPSAMNQNLLKPTISIDYFGVSFAYIVP